MNWSAALTTLVPPAVVTLTSTVRSSAGAVARMLVGLCTVTAVPARPPNDTVAPAAKPDPPIVTRVPPPDGPEIGATEVTEGAAGVEDVCQVTMTGLDVATSPPPAPLST